MKQVKDVIEEFGFTKSGVARGSDAAFVQSQYGGNVPRGSAFSKLQSAGASDEDL